MTHAQERLGVLAGWITASSARRKAQMGSDWIDPGPYAVIVPWSLAGAPNPSAFAPRHLPIWIPEQQAVPELLPVAQAEPENQDHVAERLRHIVWKYMDGWFEGALIPLIDPAEPLQAALTRNLPTLDLEDQLALFLPLWMLDPKGRAWADAHLPLVVTELRAH